MVYRPLSMRFRCPSCHRPAMTVIISYGNLSPGSGGPLLTNGLFEPVMVSVRCGSCDEGFYARDVDNYVETMAEGEIQSDD